ncbi:COX15/CtaA family protein [Vibrio maerlii]|uniref:COX15/CtaA family protein n=1 Tax=Vibrio maerlii TaxID=2231648 RepID=UPI000E3D76C1|nr:COX15/CtaA family protein [Vibrio maerlii]
MKEKPIKEEARQHTDSPRVLINLTRWIIGLTLVVIVLGAYTRLSDAGLGCPDWPGCYGQLLVPQGSEQIEKANQLYPERAVESGKAWLEMIHRYFAGSLGLMVFAMTFIAIRKTQFRVLPALISAVIIFQALLGMWTVTLKLMPVVVMGHLLGGFSLLCLLVLFHCRLTFFSLNGEDTSKLDSERQNGMLRRWAFASLAVVALQIILGGWTSSNYAALMCTSLPICEGPWWNYLDFKTAFSFIQPGFDNYEFGVLEYPARMTIHVSHRIGAMVTTLVVLGLIWQLIKNDMFKVAIVVCGLLVVQVGLGIANVVLHLPLANAVLHNLVAAILLSCLVVVNYGLASQAQSVIAKLDSKQEAYNE